ncbi:MAG: hypothetical protein KatS3mg109_2094 [Pirellulaceae bacterium]|nr:MAG: hypothetical protein KatS3mg109_2094 [Pirellulaceae bacterium]
MASFESILGPDHEASDEVGVLLENARLRDALEPFADEALQWGCRPGWTTREENRYLAALLAWELAPVLPIAQWFEPELQLPSPERLTDEQVAHLLESTLQRLYERGVVVEFTDHLSDRQLYVLLLRDILPSLEKRLETREGWLCWYCVDPEWDEEVWLTYYASEQERRQWQLQEGRQPPPRRTPPHRRVLPQHRRPSGPHATAS